MNLNDYVIFISTSFFALVVGGAIAFPRIMSGKRRDEGDLKFAESQQKMLSDMETLFSKQREQMSISNDQLQQANDHMAFRIREIREQVDKLQRQLIQTRALLFEFEGLLIGAGIEVPEETRKRMDDLMKDTQP